MDVKVTLTDDAIATLQRMRTRVGELAVWFGGDSREYREAAHTYGHAVSCLFDYRELTVWRDGELSLCGITHPNQFTFGLIYHGEERRCTSRKCRAVINDDGKVWTYGGDDYVCLDGHHTLSYPLDCPAPGIWSFHS